ncbi:MAG: 30S ribosomal protein S20 [Alphaproteobacteria bacterium]|nr:30S ribosomal protein S20 [Alphaproteobacteria bacterium]
MPIILSAKKALRASKNKRVFNIRKDRAMKDTMHAVKKAVTEKNKTEAKKLFTLAQQAIDKAVKRGIIKANNGARKKSRLLATIAKIGT